MISKFNAEKYFDPTAYAALTKIELDEYRAIIDRTVFRPFVYICSPFSGDIYKNIACAVRYSRFAVFRQTIPIAPHLLFPQFLDDSNPGERELGLFMGLVLLSKCKELWVFGKIITKGMSAEISKAESRGIPVRYFDESCAEVRPK